jgi:hypothetical protein
MYIHDKYARLGGYVSAASGGRKEITDWHHYWKQTEAFKGK